MHYIRSVNTTFSDNNGNNTNTINNIPIKKFDVTSLWHKILGHEPLRALKKIENLHNVQLKEHLCTVCLVARQTRLPFSLSNTWSIQPFDLRHADVWGLYRVPTLDGRRYFMTLVNDYSRFT